MPMNFSKSTENFLDYFINEYENFEYKESKQKKKLREELYLSLYKELINSQKELNLSKEKLHHNLSYITLPEEQTPKTNLLNSKFVPQHIKKYIFNNGLFYMVYKVKIKKRDITIYLVFYDENDLNDLDQFNNIIAYMLLWLNIASKNSSIRCTKSLNIYLYLTPFLKELPENCMETLGPKNCNSGLTTTCSLYNEICVFRKEEFFKVFIHETFHCYGLDFSTLDSSKYEERLRNIFPLNINFNLYEAYCEFWATMFNNAIISHSTLKRNNIKVKKFDEFKHYMHLCNNIERMFSLYQINKILLFHNIGYENFYEKNEISKYIRNNLYKEKTSVFSYYILKGVLLYHFTDFLSWCNDKNITLYKFDKQQGNVNQMIEFIKERFNNSKLIMDLKKMNIMNYESKDESVERLDKTLRMSLLEIKI